MRRFGYRPSPTLLSADAGGAIGVSGTYIRHFPGSSGFRAAGVAGPNPPQAYGPGRRRTERKDAYVGPGSHNAKEWRRVWGAHGDPPISFPDARRSGELGGYRMQAAHRGGIATPRLPLCLSERTRERLRCME